MAKSLLRNNSQSPITLPPPYTGIIAPGDSVVLDDPPSVVAAEIGIFPELISYLQVSQVPDSQPVDGHDRGAAAAGIVAALASAEEPIDINGQRIVNAAAPVDPQDLATKLYVDTHGGGGGGGSVTNVTSTNAYMTVANGTTTPALTVNVGTGVNDVAAGTDTRFNTAPSTAGGVVYDTGTGYTKTAAGAVGKVLKAGAGGIPEWADDSTTPTGAAGGSLAGTYPNPTIASGVITNTEISNTAAIATSKLSGALTDITGNGLATFVADATKVARTYYVAVNGNDANNGSIYKPFASISAALTAADGETVGNHVIINVGPGTFTEDVSVTRYNTLLIGSGGRAEAQSTRITGSVTVNPATAASKTGHTIYMTGFYISPPNASANAALRITGAGLFQFIATDCYITTGSTNANAFAVYSDVSNAGRPRIFLQDCVISTQGIGPTTIVNLAKGDCRIFRSQVGHGSSVVVGSIGSVISLASTATLWADSALIESRGSDAAINAIGAATETKLILTNSNVTVAYNGASAHGVYVTNTPALAAYIYQTAFNVATTTGYALTGTAPALVAYADLSFAPGTNSAINTPTVTLIPATEKHGTVNLPSLSASLPLKLDVDKNVTTAAIALDGSEVTNTLPIGKGGTGISTAPTAGGVVYGGASTQAYSAAGTAGTPLLSGGADAPSFGALDLSVAANVKNALPKANQAAQDVGGNLSGTTDAAVVIKIQNNPIKSETLAAGDAGKALVWSGSEYQASTITPGGGGGGGLTYYLNYGVAGEAPTPNGADKQLSLTFSTPAAPTAATTAPNGGSHATLAQFVTPFGQPGATTIPPGVWDINVYLLASHADSVFFRAAVYTWNGTTLSAALATSNEVEITTIGPTPVAFTASVAMPQTVLASDARLVIRIEISRTVSAGRTVTGYFGDGTPSHAHTTIGAPGGTGLVKVVDGVVQAPATLLFDADVDLDANISFGKMDGNAGSGGTAKVLHGSENAGDPPTWGAVALGSEVSGQLAVGNGGTGLASGTSGGMPYFSATDTIASSALLSANALVLGGGAGSAPSTLGSLGTTSTVLHGNDSGAPSFGAVALASDVSGTLPVTNGGTGTLTAPTAGGVVWASSTSAYGSTDLGTAGYLLKSNGLAAPSWLDVVPVANGGTGVAEANNNVIFAGPSTGTSPGAPSFRALVKADLPAATVYTDGSYADPSWITSLAGSKVSGDISGNAANVTGTVAVLNGGTGATTAADARTNLSAAEKGANSDITSITGLTTALAVTQGGTGTLTAPTAAGGAIYAASTSAYGSTAAGTAGQYLKSNADAAPAWADLPYDVASMVADKPLSGATVFLFRAVRSFVLSSTNTDHKFSALTGATLQSDFTVYLNSISVPNTMMTARFAADGQSGAQDATVTMGAASTSITAGDLIFIVAPATADATLANIYWTLKGRL